jgi:GTPase involved in cell partitioning and DNA repair
MIIIFSFFSVFIVFFVYAANVTEERVAVLQEEGEEFVLAKGGVGGFGNAHFVSATNRSPKESTCGTKIRHCMFKKK